jgi:hypothetical protein
MNARTDNLMAQLESVVHDLEPEQRLRLIEYLTGIDDAVSADPPAVNAERLQEARSAYEQRYDFAVGQLVRWKAGLRNKQLPEYGQPAVVVDLFDEAIVNVAEPADSPYFRERLDVVLGVFDGDTDFALFHYDAQRFEPFD